ncbi:MAG: hypothetical protein JXR40_12925 [Pontiellaceae bacterium]|nr:hypothetical protein [Pontiellaceae bacterium]
MKTNKKRSSILKKLNLILLLSASLIFIGSCLYSYLSKQSNINKEKEELASFMAGNLSASLAQPLFNYDLDSSAKIIEAGLLEKQVYGIQVSYEDQIQLGRARDADWKVVDNTEEISGDYYKISTPITYQIEGDPKPIEVGTVDVFITSKFMKEELSRSITIMIIGFVLVTVVFLGALSLAIGKWVVKPIAEVTSGIDEGTEQLNAYSSQVSSTIQTLAASASRQAESSQNATASLEELSDMVHKIANSASETDNMMNEAIKTVKTSSISIEKLQQSIQEISDSGREISTLVKTIDEIAFQTNLLALNAAVEAARAGAAGSGFAVVANEVKSLANRTSKAANLTAEVVEATQNKIAIGGQIAAETIEGFRRTDEFITSTGKHSSQICVTTEEQVQRIDRINSTVQESDIVAQENAANAEEIASASQEMQCQVGLFRNYIVELMNLIGKS